MEPQTTAADAPVHAIVSTPFPVDVVIQGDCIEVMRSWPDGCVNAIITDPPYGITANKWDNVPDLESWWREVWRVCRGPVVMTASQPFTSEVVMSQRKAFKHEWIWHKSKPSGVAFKNQPMRNHESILVFGNVLTFNPILEEREGFTESSKKRFASGKNLGTYASYGNSTTGMGATELKKITEKRKPTTVKRFASVPNRLGTLHPSQKPQALFEYLVMTYTNKGDTVCDPFGGSGTTAAAAQNTGRRYVSIEAKAEYVEIQRQRLAQRVMF